MPAARPKRLLKQMVNGKRDSAMKKVYIYCTLAILAITACQTKELDVPVLEESNEVIQREAKVFTATIDDDFGLDTKTSLDAEGNVLWKQGDQVSIFAASTNNEQYQVSDDSDGKTAGTLNKIPEGSFVAGTGFENNVAFYPYASTASITKSGSNYVISDITLPATQTYAAASFGNGAFPMAAVTSSNTDMNLKFKNVLGGLKLQLKGTATIISISIIGNNNEILCGTAQVTAADGAVPSISMTNASAKTVTLDCGAGVALDAETATSFIIALPPMTMTGGFTVIVRDAVGKQMEIKTTKTQTISRSNLLKMPAETYEGGILLIGGHQYVDLGLPSGLKWATCNVGATAPADYGDYFAWGETEPKSDYSWETYKFWVYAKGANTTYDINIQVNKYCTEGDPPGAPLPYWGGTGSRDDKTVLDPEDDAAHVNWGGSWRMPTLDECQELIDNCTWTYSTTPNNVKGMIVTSKSNGNFIFLPMAGWMNGTDLKRAGETGQYWSSALDTDYPVSARRTYFDKYNSIKCSGNNSRRNGLSVRPVSE